MVSENNNLVYFKTQDEAWSPAKLLEQNDKSALVEIENGEQIQVDLTEYRGNALPQQNVDDQGNLIEIEDMANLSYLHEAAILYNLKSRHFGQKPYTRTGDIVIAINPYQWFDGLYTEKQQRLYTSSLVEEGAPVSELSPHVYEVSALAYRGLKTGINQSILVSGESGAGKTETVKICMSHLTSMQSVKTDTIQKVLDTNPLLEAFGNAQTRRNDNSSRFGKYIELQFKDGVDLVGSNLEFYLLEKSRVVHHESAERTFHVFYQLLSSPDKVKGQFWSKLRGKTAESFRYVGTSSVSSIEGKDDAEHFTQTVKALQSLGVDSSKLNSLMQALCSVLQLGNIRFSGCNDSSKVTTAQELSDLADLLGVSEKVLGLAFTERTMKTRSETYKVPLSMDSAKESCDALAKEIYHRIFTWLVELVKTATSVNGMDTASQLRTVGLLDIFGFESFETNGFEQLCINYANEKLQQKFTDDIFRSVEMEYKFEGIDLDNVNYSSNSDVVDLIESRMGLLAMLNEECVRPSGSDREFVYKAIFENKGSSALVVQNSHSRLEFGVHHYCSSIVYNAKGFVAKNNDALATDLLECASKSSNEIVAYDHKARSSSRRGGNVVAATVWTEYKGGLLQLMECVKETKSRYIRCIKPNHEKAPLKMDNNLCMDQLRSAGVLSAIEVTRSAYPNRLEHLRVWERFSCFFPADSTRVSMKTQRGLVENVRTLLASLEMPEGDSLPFEVGKSKTYFRAGVLEALEAKRFNLLENSAKRIQPLIRGYLSRKVTSKIFLPKDLAATTIQRCIRVFLQKTAKPKATKKNAKIESLRRMKAAREKRMKSKAAAVIQAIVRGVLQRPKYQAALKERKELGSIQEQIEHLKRRLAKSKEEKEQAVKAAEDRVTKAIAGMKDDGMDSSELQNISSMAKLEESAKVVDFLKREMKRLMQVIKVHKTRCERVVEQQKQQDEITEAIHSKMEDINEYKRILERNREVLEKNKEIYVQQIKAYRKEIQKGKTYKQNEDDIRAVYQAAVEKIVALVQEECTDDELVEDIYLLAMENSEYGDDDYGDLEDLEEMGDLSDYE